MPIFKFEAINDKGKVIKEQSAAGFTFLAEPKFKALDLDNEGSDLLSSVAVPYTGKLPLAQHRTAVYKLDLPEGVDLDLEGGRQEIRDNVLIVTRENLPDSGSNDKLSVCGANDGLQASVYVQSNHGEIKEMAREIIGAERNPVKQVQLLSQWLFVNLEKRPVIGLPDALTTLKSRQGDCNEHAALFAALSRSIGIPTIISTGVTQYRDAFYYHAWNEVCIDSKWISLDTTTNQFPADLTHLRFARGDMAQQIKIGALIGKLKIEILPIINPKKTR